jgi:hypothetical protein
VLTFDGASTGAKAWGVANLKDVVVVVHSLDVIPGDKSNLFVRGDESTVVVAQYLLDHGWPPVGECTSLADEGEVGGVGNAVCVDSTVHLATVEVSESFDLVGKFRVSGEGWDCRVKEQRLPEYARELECESFRQRAVTMGTTEAMRNVSKEK